MATVGKHGGARPGAGRPKREGELHTVTVRLDKRNRALLDEMCAVHHASQSELVALALDALVVRTLQKKPSKSK